MLNDLCLQGAFPNAFIYHICGMPWASTNNVDFYKWINTVGATQTTVRNNLFGRDAENVQVLFNLKHNLGGQSVTYGEDKGINVGGWSVSIDGGASGFKWNNETTMEQWGIIGLDWQPVESTDGACVTLLASDIIPDFASANKCDLTWEANKDIGSKKLIDWLDDNWGVSSYDNDLYIYTSSSCLRPSKEAVNNLDGTYTVECVSGRFNAPCEDIIALKQRQQIYVTNYPQGIEGLTANLYGLLFNNGSVQSGTTPYLFRNGKIKNNATQDNQGNWSISMGGFTDQLKFKNAIGQYSGNLKGFFFNKKDSDQIPSKTFYHTPFLYVIEYSTDTTGTAGNLITESEIFELTSDYEEFTSADDIKAEMTIKMNASSNLNFNYKSSNGDITVGDPKNPNYEIKNVLLSGLGPFVAGVGYMQSDVDVTNYIQMMSDPINSNFNMRSYESDGSYGFYNVALRSYDADVPARGTLPENETLINLRTTPLDYFIQTDMSQARRDRPDIRYFEDELAYPIAEDSIGDQYLTIDTNGDSEINLASGMLLHFGQFGDEESALAISGEINTVTDNEITFTSNSITGLPMALYNNSSFLDKLDNDPEYLETFTTYASVSGTTIDDVREKFSTDLFSVKDATVIKVEDAIDVFKGALGDPSTDIGLNLGAVKTDIKNLFDRGDYNFTPMVNWDKFRSLVEDNNIDGMGYTYTPNKNGDVDMLKLLINLCLTFKIQMIWEYNPTERSWWLNFDEFGEGNIANTTINARIIEELDISANELTAIVGGGWYYTKLQGMYNTVDGGTANLNYQLTDGRIGHSLRDKVLTIDDKVTLLPIDSKGEDARDLIIDRFATMLRLFSQVVYKQKLALNLRKTAIIGVGRWHIADWKPIQNRQTGRRNDGKLIGQIQSQNINLSSGLIDVDLLSYPSDKLGIAPTMYANTVSKSSDTVTITGLSLSPQNNDFGDTDSLLTDQMYFQCIDEVSGQLKDRDCTCNGYRVTIFERKPTDNKLYFDATYADSKINVFRGTIEKKTVAQISTSIDIELDGGGTYFDTTADWVVIFADRADTGLCQCQIDLYGWLGDSNNQVSDGTSTFKGITVGN